MSHAWSSGHRFRTFVAAAPVGIYECDSEGACLFVNKRWCALTGLTARQAAGDGWVKAIHPEDHDRVAAGWRHATATGAEFSGEEYRFQRPDGSVTWVSGSAVALRGSDGEIAGYLGTCEDITERKRAQEGLERDARSFDISRDLLIEARLDGVLERVNAASMAILGWRPDEMIGQPYTNFVHPDDADLSDVEVARLAAGGTTVAFRNRYRTPEGAWRWLEWNAVGIPAEGRLYAAARDITERLELEAELQREHRQLEDAQAGLKEAEEIAQLGSWDWDVVADSVTWSDGMHALYGTEAGNFPATLAAMVEPIHLDDRRRIQAQARAAVVDGLPYEIEYRLLRADGELRWHSGRGRPHLGTDGNVVRIVGTLQDVTERKQAELLLQASELRYRSLGENLPSTSVLTPAEESDTTALVDTVLPDLAPAIENGGAVVEVGALPAVRGDSAAIERGAI